MTLLFYRTNQQHSQQKMSADLQLDSTYRHHNTCNQRLSFSLQMHCMYRLDMGVHTGVWYQVDNSDQQGIHKYNLLSFLGSNNRSNTVGRHFVLFGCYMFLLCTLMGRMYLPSNSDQWDMVLQMLREPLGLGLKIQTGSKILDHICQ